MCKLPKSNNRVGFTDVAFWLMFHWNKKTKHFLICHIHVHITHCNQEKKIYSHLEAYILVTHSRKGWIKCRYFLYNQNQKNVFLFSISIIKNKHFCIKPGHYCCVVNKKTKRCGIFPAILRNFCDFFHGHVYRNQWSWV